MQIDYQQIVDICAQALQAGLPIGIIFGLASWAKDFFLSCVFGKEKVKL